MFIVFTLIVIYALFFTGVSFFKYDNFLYGDFDLAHHAQEIWNVLHGSIDCSILGLKFLGNHVHIIEFLIAPIYAIFTTPKTLLFLQSLFLGLAAWPLYLIAKKHLPKVGAISIVFCYLIYPALGYVNLFEFHPQSLAIFFILFTFYFFEKENMKSFLIFMFLSLICQENISLLIIMFGFYALIIKKKIKWAVIPLLTGVAWFAFSVLAVLPYFNRGEVGFYNIYSHLGSNIYEITANIFLHPIKVTRYLLNAQNAIYLFQLFAPVSFLPLLGKGILLFFIPPLLQHLLSQRFSEHTIYYQYTIEIIPFIFIGMVYGLKRILEVKIIERHKKKLFLFIPIIALFFNLIWGPHFSLCPKIINYKMKHLVAEKSRLVNLIPPAASVVATFEFLPRLAHREKLYSFHHLYIGKHTLSSKKYLVPVDLEYALVDFSDSLTFRGFYDREGDTRIRKFLEEGKWGAVEMVGNIILFKGNYITSLKPYRIVQKKIRLDDVLTLENGEIAFFDYNTQLTSINGREYARLKINYKCLKPTNKNYWLGIQIVDQNDQIVYNDIHPITYGIYPTYRWETGQSIEEALNLPWPKEFKEGKYKVVVVVFSSRTRLVEHLSNKEDSFQAGEIELVNGKIRE